MLQFEALLLKQLQRQQSRAEFCDTVLQSQGVLVPVHSCVLSAFSPWLCGALSSMPAPVAGKRRLIELQSVEACTLLSLVSLLYSGQINGNRKDILSAAELLGIRLPEEHAEETHGEKERRRKEHAGAEQQKESNPQGVGQHEKSLEMTVGEKIRESGTQTERERETDERETQTDYVCSDHQQNFHVISHAACSSISHEQGTYTNAPDATVMLQGVQVPPERTSTCDALPVASETQVCQIVSEPECVSQAYYTSLHPPEPSYHQPLIPVTPHPPTSNTYLEIGPVQSEGGGVTLSTDDVVEGFEQFEGNIPGFISFFLDPARAQSTERRGRGRPRGTRGARGERPARRARVRSRGEGTVRGRGRGRGGKGQSRAERWGWAPRLAWRGQGGGKVGRKLDTRPTGKVRLTRRLRGSGALLEVGEGRGRGRKRGRRCTHAVSEGEGGPPCLSSSRSHPHECSLPLSPCSSSFCQNSVGTPDPSLLHTVSLPPVPQTSTQSMDLLLDDIMLGLNFLPPVHTENQTQQNRFVKTMIPSIPSVTKKACPSMHSSVKPLDLSRQQPEGELCDILEHFLNTFEQHVAGCDLGVAEETPHNQSNHYTSDRGLDEAQVNRDPGTESWSNTTFKPLPPLNSHPHANVSSHCVRGPNTFTTSTEPPPISSSAADTSADQNQLRLSTALRQLNPSSRAGFKGKFESKEKEPQTQRVTRSQSRKRKLEATLSSLQTPASPVKKKCRRKQSSRLAGKERPQVRSLCRQRKHCIADICVSKVSNAGANKSNRTQTRTTKDAKRATTRSLSRKRCLETNVEEKTCRANTEGSELETEHASASSRTSQLPAKKTIGGAYIEVASSAFEKMRMLLENQRKREEERSRTEKQSIHIENVRVGIPRVEEDASGVKEGLAAENTSHSHLEKSGEERADGRAVEAEDNDRTESAENAVLEEKSETVELGCRQENGKVAATEMEQMMTSEPSTSFQTDLLPDTEPVKSSLVAEESDHNNNEPLLRTAEITQSTFCSSSSHTVSSDVLQLPCSHQDLTSSAKGTEMADLTLESGEMTPVKPAEGKLKFLLSSLPHHKLLLSHSPEKAVSGGGSEEEEVDVLEVSSPASEIVIMPTDIWGAELSTEEEDVEEDMDVDVVGVELD